MRLAFTQQRSFIISSTVSLLVFYSPGTYADEAATGPAIGQVVWTKGDVKAEQPNGSPRALQRRSSLYEHDSVTTAKDASGEVSFADGTVVSLNPETEMKVDEYKSNKSAPAQDKSVMTLVKGGFRTITGSIPKENPDAYKINTPVATIGVRGTEYVTVLSPTKGLLLKVDKGAIEVKNAAGKLELSKCEQNNGQNNCNRYGVVGSFSIAPAAVTTMPPELATVTPITPVPGGIIGAPLGAPAGPAGATTPDGSGGAGGSSSIPDATPSSTPTSSVSSFCVGLLKDLYQTISNLFA